MATLAEQIRAKRREIVTDALIRAGANRTRAAEALGLSARQMFRIVAEELTDHDIDVIRTKCLNSGTLDQKAETGALRL